MSQPPPYGGPPAQPYPPAGGYAPGAPGYYPPAPAAPPVIVVQQQQQQQQQAPVILGGNICSHCNVGRIYTRMPCWAVAVMIILIFVFWPAAIFFCYVKEHRCDNCGSTHSSYC